MSNFLSLPLEVGKKRKGVIERAKPTQHKTFNDDEEDTRVEDLEYEIDTVPNKGIKVLVFFFLKLFSFPLVFLSSYSKFEFPH